MQVDHIGVPLDLGSERIGVDMGPNALRYQHYLRNLKFSGLKVNDLGNIPCPSPEEVSQGNSRIKYLNPIEKVCKKLARKVQTSIKKGSKVLVVGGDHSIAIGSISGASTTTETLGVIWIDSHADLNTEKTTPSGNIHGMPLATLLGHGHKKLTNITSKTPAITYENLVLISIKDLDPPEIKFIKKHNLSAFYIKDILANGLDPVFNAIMQLKEKVNKVWLSLDLDAIDVDQAPGVGMPNKGGLTYREIQAIIDRVGKVCDILGMDLVEYNPVNDIQHKTAILSAELTARAFKKQFSWYTKYLKTHAVR